MKRDCSVNTDSQMNLVLPLLMMEDNSNTSSTDEMLVMIIFQSMGNSPIGMSQILPLLMDDKIDDDAILMMLVMLVMASEMDCKQGLATI